jgi:hypothetical protein
MLSILSLYRLSNWGLSSHALCQCTLLKLSEIQAGGALQHLRSLKDGVRHPLSTVKPCPSSLRSAVSMYRAWVSYPQTRRLSKIAMTGLHACMLWVGSLHLRMFVSSQPCLLAALSNVLKNGLLHCRLRAHLQSRDSVRGAPLARLRPAAWLKSGWAVDRRTLDKSPSMLCSRQYFITVSLSGTITCSAKFEAHLQSHMLHSLVRNHSS